MSNLSPLLKDTIQQLPLANTRLQSILLESYRARFPGNGIEFQELQAYVPGEDVHSIDWKASARLGDVFIKKYMLSSDNNILFAIDTSSSMNSIDHEGKLKLQSILATTFLLARTAYMNGDRVGFFYRMHDRYVHRPFSPRLSSLIPELSRIEQVIRHSTLEKNDWTDFFAHLNSVKKRCICFVVTDDLDFKIGTISKLKLASTKHSLLFVELTNWLETIDDYELEPALADIETGERLDWVLDDPKTLEKIKEERLEKQLSSVVIKIPARYINVAQVDKIIYNVIDLLSGKRRKVLTRTVSK